MREEYISSLKSPLSGIFLNLSEVPDPVFSEKMVGDGFAIDPSSNILCSPVAGTVKLIHKGLHAITIETETGVQVLMHIGIDTVNLKSQGLKALVEVGSYVKEGTPLIEFDMDYLALHAKSLITPILILNPEERTLQTSLTSGTAILLGDVFYQYQDSQNNIIANATSLNNYSETLDVNLKDVIHARPAAKIVSLAKEFNATITIQKLNSEKTANAKSLLDLLSLEIQCNDSIKITTSGDDAQTAIKSLIHAFKNLSQEAHHEEETQSLPTIKSTAEMPHKNVFMGTCSSNGLTIGNLFQYNKKELIIPESFSDPQTEINLFEKSLQNAISEISSLKIQIGDKLGNERAEIFNAHIEILKDPILKEKTIKLINENKNASYAWAHVFKNAAKELSQLSNQMLAARAADILDIGERVLSKLLNEDIPLSCLDNIPKDSILVAHNLTPSETVHLDPEKIKGFITVSGGGTSHVAILARSLGIPSLVAVPEQVLSLPNGTPAILNANLGILKIHFNQAEKEEALLAINQNELERSNALLARNEKAVTLDGVEIEVSANISHETEITKAVELGCDGVGLLRSEFLFSQKVNAPSAFNQTVIYQKMFDQLCSNSDRPLIIRTLDAGGDKPLPYIPIDFEENPFLGERGIRVSLENKQIFSEQLRAILSIKPLKNISIMFPMVSSLDELLEAKNLLEIERKKLGVDKISIGIMIEVPAAALMAHVFAPHVDFFSIGANDLTQYTLAIDRGHSKLAKKVDSLSPAVLKLIEQTCEAGKKHNIWTGVCGGIASDLDAISILIGLGVTELSVSIPMIPLIKDHIRKLSISDCKEIAKKALHASSSEEVRLMIKGNRS